MNRRLVLTLLLLFLSTNAFAGAPKRLCMDVVKALPYALAGVNKKNFVFTLQRQGRAYFVLMVSKNTQGNNKSASNPYMPWRLIERQGQSLNYCLIAAGKSVELLTSMEQAPTPNKYGMPGSGYPRCSSDSGAMSEFGVRVWANKELGESMILHLNASVGDRNFTFLASSDNQHWILLDQKQEGTRLGPTCYYARGDGLVTHEDFPLPKAH